MIRQIAIGLTVAVITGASIVAASARGGHGGPGGVGHAGFAHSGGAASFSGMHSFSGAHSFAFHGEHVVGRGFGFRHRLGHRFFFAGAPYAYGYYDDGCYVPVRTRWGLRWRDVCY